MELTKLGCTILIDCDGILSDFIHQALLEANKISGARYTTNDVANFDFTDLPLYADHRPEIWQRISLPGWCRQLEPYDKAVEGFQYLTGLVETVKIVTSSVTSSPTWAFDRVLWLKDVLGVQKNDIISTSSKENVFGDFLIEDSVENIEKWCESWQHGEGILWTRPWNANRKVPENCTRVSSWNEVYVCIQRIWD